MARLAGLVSALLLWEGTILFGQAAAPRRVYLAGRVGGNLVSTDPETGSSVGRGGSFGFFFSDRWAFDIEAWIPAYAADHICPPGEPPGPCPPARFRNLGLGVAVARRFGGDGIHPYLVVGVSKLWMQNRTQFVNWTRNEGIYPQGGAGLAIPLSTRVLLAPEVRLDYLVLGGILRPSLTLVYGLR